MLQDIRKFWNGRNCRNESWSVNLAPCHFSLPLCCGPMQVMASSMTRFLCHTQRRTTVCRSPLGEWSVRRSESYLTTHNTHNRQTSKTSMEFEPTISACYWPQTCALDSPNTCTVVPANTHTYTYTELFKNRLNFVVYISWTIHSMWMIYITFQRGGPTLSNTTTRALAWACGTYGGKERCAQGFGWETWGKETIGETKT